MQSRSKHIQKFIFLSAICGSFCFFLSCVCYAFVRVCLYVPCGRLLGKGRPLGSRLWYLTVSLSLSIDILGQLWYLIVSIPDLCTVLLTLFEGNFTITPEWVTRPQPYCCPKTRHLSSKPVTYRPGRHCRIPDSDMAILYIVFKVA